MLVVSQWFLFFIVFLFLFFFLRLLHRRPRRSFPSSFFIRKLCIHFDILLASICVWDFDLYEQCRMCCLLLMVSNDIYVYFVFFSLPYASEWFWHFSFNCDLRLMLYYTFSISRNDEQMVRIFFFFCFQKNNVIYNTFKEWSFLLFWLLVWQFVEEKIIFFIKCVSSFINFVVSVALSSLYYLVVNGIIRHMFQKSRSKFIVKDERIRNKNLCSLFTVCTSSGLMKLQFSSSLESPLVKWLTHRKIDLNINSNIE